MSESQYDSVEEALLAKLTQLREWQEMDRREVMRYAGEEAENLVRRKPEVVHELYVRMQERARRMFLLQDVLEKRK